MALKGITEAQLNKKTNTPTDPVQNTLESHSKQLENMNNMLLLGFAILLVMVATIVISTFLDYKHSADQLLKDQYQFIQNRIDHLEKTATQSAK